MKFPPFFLFYPGVPRPFLKRSSNLCRKSAPIHNRAASREGTLGKTAFLFFGYLDKIILRFCEESMWILRKSSFSTIFYSKDHFPEWESAGRQEARLENPARSVQRNQDPLAALKVPGDALSMRSILSLL
jgi:hypothetical protein